MPSSTSEPEERPISSPPSDPVVFAARVRSAIAGCREAVDRFASGAPEPSFVRAIARYDALTAPLNGVVGFVHLYTQAHPDAGMRRVCEELERELAALGTEISLHEGLYRALRALEPPADAADDERRLHEHALRDFRRSGVDRDEAIRAEIRALQEELVRIGQEFDRNIVAGTREFVIREGSRGLAGLPEDFVRSHPEREDGSVVITTDPHDRIAFLTYAERADLRRDYYRLALNRAFPENLEILRRLLAKRHELATRLGFSNWADYVTEDKMTGSAAEARAFLERVVGLVRGRALEEYEELLAHKRVGDPSASAVGESERIHLTERVKALHHGFDSQSVRPYFPYRRAVDGLLDVVSELYGVAFRERPDVAAWHADVRCYDVLEDGERIARFYLDMHPRPDKFKHAAMFHLADGVEGGVLPEAALLCNFPRPAGDDPGLLLHEQVTTLFHEFGHLLHHLFAGRQRFLRFSGISTERDFVEVPSQMFEEWAWRPEVLARFARHHETGEPIPPELVERMRAAEEYGKALHVLQQLFYALLSLAYYDRDPSGLDPVGTMRALKQELLPVPHEEGTCFPASFGHLHGYSAMYYTYMWSLVIAKDLFSRFEQDPMRRTTARAYRDEVLAPGGSRDGAELVRRFLGRDYGFESFERWLGA